VIEAIKILNDKFDKCRSTYISQNPNKTGRFFVISELEQKNPNCYVCSSNWATLKIDTLKTNFEYLIKEVAINALNFKKPSIFLGSKILFESVEEDDEDDFQSSLSKNLYELGIVDNSIIKLDDFEIEFSMQLTILHTQMDEPPFEILGKIEEPKEKTVVMEQKDNPDDGDVLIYVPKDRKRKREEYKEDKENNVKKQKITVDIIEL